MDVTPLFKACIKTIRTRNKAFGMGADSGKSKILGNKTRKTEFAIKAKEVVSNITRLRDFLLEHRKAYLNTSSHLLSELQQMTDCERDQIDVGAQRIMKTCSQLIHDFKKDMSKQIGNSQTLEHRQGVTELIETYLMAVCKIYSEQKAVRVKRAVDLQKMARLESETRMAKKDTVKRKGSLNVNKEDENVISGGANVNKMVEEPSKKIPRKMVPENSDCYSEEDNLSSEEMQMFELENAQLYNELNSLVDEVRQIEGKVVEITELQEIFTEKVLQQEKDIGRIADTVSGTTENIKDANEQLREAIQKNAGFRVWILFFLLVMSFSLLFLDWYND